jgi:hypothetical protein
MTVVGWVIRRTRDCCHHIEVRSSSRLMEQHVPHGLGEGEAAFMQGRG